MLDLVTGDRPGVVDRALPPAQHHPGHPAGPDQTQQDQSVAVGEVLQGGEYHHISDTAREDYSSRVSVSPVQG